MWAMVAPAGALALGLQEHLREYFLLMEMQAEAVSALDFEG